MTRIPPYPSTPDAPSEQYRSDCAPPRPRRFLVLACACLGLLVFALVARANVRVDQRFKLLGSPQSIADVGPILILNSSIVWFGFKISVADPELPKRIMTIIQAASLVVASAFLVLALVFLGLWAYPQPAFESASD
jgi:hypothetical protein